MARVTCPYCGAVYEVPEGVTHAVCPYCGTVVELATGREAPTYYYPWRLEEQEAYTYAMERLETLPGAPRRLGEEAGYQKGVLHMVSLYVYRLSARAEGCEAAREDAEEALLASDAPRGFPEDYTFPVVGRAPYKPGLREGIVFHTIRGDAERMKERLGLRERLALRVKREASVFCGIPDALVKLDVEMLGVAHYPVWELVYTYRGGGYRVLVDAVDPRILYAEYPADRRRVSRLLGGYAGGAGVAALLALAQGGNALIATLAGGVIGAAIAVLELLLRGRRVYRGEKPWTTRPAYGVFTRAS